MSSDYEKLKKLYDQIDSLLRSNVTSSSPEFKAWHGKCLRFLSNKYVKLYEADYIKANIVDIDNSPLPFVYEIYDITFQGHEFLNNTRNDSVWEKTKNNAKSIGVFSLQAIGQIAFNIVESLIKGKLGLNG